MSDDEKTVEHTERNRWNSEKIHSGNGFTVVAKKAKPAPAGLPAPRRSFHPAGNGSFGHLKTEHEKLAVDARRSPGGVLRPHLEDQLPNLFGYRTSTDGLLTFVKKLRPRGSLG